MDNGWRPWVIDALEVVAEVALLTGSMSAPSGCLPRPGRSGPRSARWRSPVLRERARRNLASAGAALGGEVLDRALRDGARLSVQEAVACARRGRGERAGATHGRVSLSPVERQVVELASRGLSNPGIAGELFISRNTVKVYLSRAYAKLGVANRTELAGLAARRSRGR
jgi:DNA-binding CsgD family transcriptional regulator